MKRFASLPSLATESVCSMWCSRSDSRTSSTSPGLSSARKMRRGLVTRRPRQRYEKRRSGAGLRFRPDPPPISLDNMLANCQPEPRPWILFVPMQALEKPENALRLLRLEPDAVVPDAHHPLAVAPFGGDMNARSLLALAVFQRIREQVLKHVRKLPLVAGYSRQRVKAHLGLILLHARVHSDQRLAQRRTQIGIPRDGIAICMCHPRISQQIPNEFLNAPDSGSNVVGILL